MEWVDGSSLRDLVASGDHQPAATIANIGAQMRTDSRAHTPPGSCIAT